MGDRLTPEALRAARDELVQLLTARPVAELRQITRGWNWPIKGTAKAEIAAQLADLMSDTDRMVAAYRSLPSREQDILAWGVRLSGGTLATLADCLSYPNQGKVSAEEIKRGQAALADRGLLYFGQFEGYYAPMMAQEWIPNLDPPWLRHKGPLGAVAPFSLADINRHLHHLLSSVEIDRPVLPSAPPPSGGVRRELLAAQGGEALVSRPGLVSPETLDSWGYHTTEERNRARFLLQQMLIGNLLRVTGGSNERRLQLDEKALRSWEQFNPIDRVNWIRIWWINPSDNTASRNAASWNELDIALQQVRNYQLRPGAWWGGMDMFNLQVQVARSWLFRLLANLAADVWMSLEALAQFVWRVKPDLLMGQHVSAAQQWYAKDKPLPTRDMSFEVWSATHGRFLQAFIAGPAAWLGFVEVGRQGGEPVCFRRLSLVDASDIKQLPSDLLQFPAGDTAVLRSAWQAGAVRPLLNRIAMQTSRDRATTTYRLDIATFRRTLQSGESADNVIELFSSHGLTLPQAMAAKLREWESRAGNYLIEENLAAIEFGDDMAPEEVQAIASLGGRRVYQAAPRCLVVLDAAAMPSLLDELRRRGYTPQVVS